MSLRAWWARSNELCPRTHAQEFPPPTIYVLRSTCWGNVPPYLAKVIRAGSEMCENFTKNKNKKKMVYIPVWRTWQFNFVIGVAIINILAVALAQCSCADIVHLYSHCHFSMVVSHTQLCPMFLEYLHILLMQGLIPFRQNSE